MCLAIDAENTVEIWGFYFGIIYHILEIRFGIFLRFRIEYLGDFSKWGCTHLSMIAKQILFYSKSEDNLRVSLFQEASIYQFSISTIDHGPVFLRDMLQGVFWYQPAFFLIMVPMKIYESCYANPTQCHKPSHPATIPWGHFIPRRVKSPNKPTADGSWNRVFGQRSGRVNINININHIRPIATTDALVGSRSQPFCNWIFTNSL